MPTLNDFITEIITGEYGLDIVNYGKDANGDFQPFEVNVDGKQYVIDEQLATKLDTLIAKDFATETTLDTRLSNLETKMDTLLNSQNPTDDTINVSKKGSNELITIDSDITVSQGSTSVYWQEIKPCRAYGIWVKLPASNSGKLDIVVCSKAKDFGTNQFKSEQQEIVTGLSGNLYNSPVSREINFNSPGIDIRLKETTGNYDFNIVELVIWRMV